ncbi:MAG: Smr/MutS family protein [Bacteroidetes bacterium]|nr:Smr/MutS family protein [Bacteroidota bacterium]
MKYQLGDKIYLLHSNEEGEVVGFINEEMVEVEVEGIRFPVYMDQIDFPYYKWFTEKKESAPVALKHIDQLKTEKSLSPKASNRNTGVQLVFFPIFDKENFEEDKVTSFKIFLVNDTPVDYFFKYEQDYARSSGFSHEGSLLAGQDLYLHNIDFECFNDYPRFSFRFTSQTDRKSNKEAFFDTVLKIKPKQLIEKIETILLERSASFSFLLMKEMPDRKDNKQDFNPKDILSRKVNNTIVQHQPTLSEPRSVIDLHIEKITDNWKGLSNYEILTIQLREFEKYFDLAYMHLQPDLIVIHGVGKGKLKDEIHQILKQKKEVKNFFSRYHPKYGYGATEIYFAY